MSHPGKPRVVVVGGGISGLAAAHRLQELAEARGLGLDVTLLEADERTGGVISTVRRDGFVLEEGPDSILAEKPQAIDLARRLGIEDRVISTRPEYRASFVTRGERLHVTPDGFYLLAPTHLLPLARTPIFSPLGKLRMSLDLVLPRGRRAADESLGSFVRRRLGREALARMAQPMVAGIYGADPEKLSLMATFPKFREMEDRHRSIILALRAGIRQRRAAAGEGANGPEARARGPRYSLFVSFDDGLQTLTDALSAKLAPGTIRTRTGVGAIYPTPEGGWRLRTNGHEELADALILAIPAHLAAELIGPFDARLGKRIAAIPYGSSATVSLAYREDQVAHPLDGVGFVVPSVDGHAILGCTFTHRKYAGRAPDGVALLRAFHCGESVGLPDDELIEATQRELAGFLGITGDPATAHVARWPGSMAQFEVGHLDRIDEIWHALRAHPGLALAGNGYRGIGIPDCIRGGESAAESVLGGLFPEK